MQPYVFIQSEDGTRDKTLLQLTGEIIHCDKMADIPRVSDAASSLTYDTVSMLPFSTIKERCSKGSNLYETVNEGEKIITMKIKEQKIITEDEFRTKFTPEDVQMDGEMEYDRTKEEYCEIIRRIIEDEISNGEGSSFVTPRKCMGKITAFSDTSALSIFNRLILHEYGCYWKFLFFDGTQYFIGASPERHLEVRNNKAFMNPISGTFRKDHSVSAEQNTTELIKFLGNQKETNELFMVTDEELKMMSTMCGAGGRIIGPLLKEMAHLVHTEYLLEGTPSPGEDIISLLRKSMYAPTVIGSPVGNACKVVAKYEQRSRSYYSSAIVLIGRDANDSLDEFLDSSITIRTLEIKPTGDFSIRVGATLVKDSIPTEEYEECNAKIRGAVSALKTPKPYTTLSCSENELVQSALLRRNKNTSRFWMDNQVDCSDQNLRGKKIVMSNNEDDFIFMLRHILERMGCEVTVFNFFELSSEAAQKVCNLSFHFRICPELADSIQPRSRHCHPRPLRRQPHNCVTIALRRSYQFRSLARWKSYF